MFRCKIWSVDWAKKGLSKIRFLKMSHLLNFSLLKCHIFTPFQILEMYTF